MAQSIAIAFAADSFDRNLHPVRQLLRHYGPSDRAGPELISQRRDRPEAEFCGAGAGAHSLISVKGYGGLRASP